VTPVVVLILHRRVEPGEGPLSAALAAIKRTNADRLARGFQAVGGHVVIDDEPMDRSLGRRLRAIATDEPAADGLVVLGSGSVPLATSRDLAAFVATAGGPRGRALANNRYSADIVAIAGREVLATIPDVRSDNAIPRWLAEEAGYAIDDLRARWRLQVDLDSLLDALLARPADAGRALASHGPDASLEPVRGVLAGVAAAGRDPAAELVVAGRASAWGLGWLERATASRTRALIEERGFRTRGPGQRPVRSVLGLLLDRDGPAALGSRLAELGDAAIVDTRVLLAHRFGADEAGWPSSEDRLASDLLLAERVRDPWLRALTDAARAAPIPVVLGGHLVVGPGLRLILAGRRPWI